MMCVSNDLVNLFVSESYIFLKIFANFLKEMLIKCSFGIGFGIRVILMYVYWINVLSWPDVIVRMNTERDRTPISCMPVKRSNTTPPRRSDYTGQTINFTKTQKLTKWMAGCFKIFGHSCVNLKYTPPSQTLQFYSLLTKHLNDVKIGHLTKHFLPNCHKHFLNAIHSVT